MSELRNYVLDRFFGFGTIIPFLRAEARYSRRLVQAPPTPETAPYLAALRRDGVVMIPGFLDDEVVAGMRAAVPGVDAFEESPEGDRAYMYRNAEKIEEFKPFFEHDLISGIVRSYISHQAFPLRRTIGLKLTVGSFPTFETNYHMDTWKQRVKAFLYLDDVGPDNAPTTYLKGSHHGFWRRATEARLFRYFRTDDRGYAVGDEDVLYLGSFWPYEVSQLKRDYGYEDLVCTGKAGTLLLFDGRGLHRATPLRAGRRLILASYWIHEGDHT